ncbi:MAG: DUF1800 domain-containing protein [Acidobacteriota bacterium]
MKSAKFGLMVAAMVMGASVMGASAQMMGGQDMQAPAVKAGQSDDAVPAPDAAQAKAAKTFAGRAKVAVKPKVVVKPAALTPLDARERVMQLLDRFTFGARPGDVDKVMAMGEDAWLAQQMNPGAIQDNALNKRLQDYPTLKMTPLEALSTFPDHAMVVAVASGKLPYPPDPLLNNVYEVQVAKYNATVIQKKADGSATPPAAPTDAEIAARKAKGKETAARIAGELFALPKEQRMAALIKMPVEDRIAFTDNGNLSNDQKNLLMGEFTGREREIFYAMSGNVNSSYYTGNELAQARVLRDVMSERQLEQVMTSFWFNHFNIYLPKDSDQWYTTAYERDVIRKHALGTFHDLLLATAESPAMMVYLDNWLSIGPDSLANGVNPKNPNAKRGARGLNENYGREVMELHTVGVNGGYSQGDVTALSAILTGWGVDNPQHGGGFAFDPKRHEPGPKEWFGYVIADDGTVTKAGEKPLPATWGAKNFGSNDAATADSVKQGVAALEILAKAPQTAQFISKMMVQYFVADAPPQALVDRVAKEYMATGGDIKAMVRAIVASPEFNSKQYFRNKVKTPEEFVASAFRATATDPDNPGAVANTLRTMGMELYRALPPTGYYLTADQWMNSVALVDRLNFAYALTNGKFAGQRFDAPKLLAMGLLAPANAKDVQGFDAKPAAGQPHPSAKAKLVGVAAMSGDAPAAPVTAVPAGADVAMRVLESEMIGEPVSAQTNELINKQIEQRPANASPTDTLNLLTALVMGSPEFQMR